MFSLQRARNLWLWVWFMSSWPPRVLHCAVFSPADWAGNWSHTTHADKVRPNNVLQQKPAAQHLIPLAEDSRGVELRRFNILILTYPWISLFRVIVLVRTSDLYLRPAKKLNEQKIEKGPLIISFCIDIDNENGS